MIRGGQVTPLDEASKPRASGDDPNDWSYTLLTIE